MDRYYENGPLPDWIGWYAQQLPHWFHAGVALLTLGVELGLAWMLFLPRRWRIICFFIVTPFQVGIILTANLAFLNYFVLALGILLLDDQFLRRMTERLKPKLEPRSSNFHDGRVTHEPGRKSPDSPLLRLLQSFLVRSSLVTRYSSLFFLGWIFYVTTALLLLMLF